MATHSLNFCNRAGKEANSLRSDSSPPFFRPLTKIEGAIKGRNGQTLGMPVQTKKRALVARFVFDGLLFLALDGALKFLLQGGKRGEAV
ncbi:hypothetical protein [Ralstonia wenshanensis]|uniref:hypothetical protein n=1 Tax=Ralstonia wenshanensis TaxID=2842456 RepID=UPI0021B1B3ED|nr:hypothetical protein [Ralstonia wenshanensis]MCT7308873.1 hypothetical protein [Ralstonia wenshanensis]